MSDFLLLKGSTRWLMRSDLADRKCYITVKTDGPVDKVAWQEIWEAVTSTTYMCAAQGKKGIQDRLGE